MSQVVLGLRSLAIKLAIFVVMAALLAWALGGTLFPRPYVIDHIENAVTVAGTNYFWRLTIEDKSASTAQWQFMAGKDGKPKPVGNVKWANGAAPIVANSKVYFGCQDADGHWFIVQLEPDAALGAPMAMPDRLAVEQQLARLKSGLPLQESAAILAQRPVVLDPAGESADVPGAGSPVGSD